MSSNNLVVVRGKKCEFGVIFINFKCTRKNDADLTNSILYIRTAETYRISSGLAQNN